METVSTWVERCRAVLEESGVHFGHGTDNAFDEAVWLVLHSLGVDPVGTFDGWETKVNSEQAGRIEQLLRVRTTTREPLAYLLGEAWFCGLRFKITQDVLVPRSPIAELIQQGFSPWVNPSRVTHALDMCTGSGCIGIAMAVLMPWMRVDAADFSPEALIVAADNVSAHGVKDRVSLLESDLFSNLGEGSYGLIVSNPPYMRSGALGDLPGEFRAEPEIGLVSGRDGLDIPLRILAAAPGHLDPGGVLVCEVGESAGRLQALLPKVPFLWLEFEHGGEGVFTMDRDQLINAHADIKMLMEKRRNVR